MSRLHEALQRASDGRAPVVPSEAEQTTGDGVVPGQSGFTVPWKLTDEPAPETAAARPRTSSRAASGAAAQPSPAAPLVSRLTDWFRQHASAVAEKLVVADDAGDKPELSVAVEQYRKLAATLYYAKAEKGIQVIVVTSALPHEGKSLTATNLALTLSESYQRRVLVVDADLRRPSLHSAFGVNGGTGLSEHLAGIESNRSPYVEVSSNLVFLPSGRIVPDPTSGLTSPRMQALIAEARTAFEWIVIDTPPIGLVSDARLVSEVADGVVIVVEAGKTPYPDIQRAVSSIERSKLVGVVLNRIPRLADGYGTYHGYYRYSPKKSA
jgi:capsular exopolysaccharide synthesis family protein